MRVCKCGAKRVNRCVSVHKKYHPLRVRVRCKVKRNEPPGERTIDTGDACLPMQNFQTGSKIICQTICEVRTYKAAEVRGLMQLTITRTRLERTLRIFDWVGQDVKPVMVT